MNIPTIENIIANKVPRKAFVNASRCTDDCDILLVEYACLYASA